MSENDTKNINFSPEDKTNEFLREAIAEIDEEILLMDGMEDAFLGLSHRVNAPILAVYSLDKILDVLMQRDGMDYDEALEFAEFNIIGAWVGERTPIIVSSTFY